MASENTVEFLILGAGWTSNFLEPALESEKIKFAATTTTGHDNSIPFKFDPNSTDKKPFQSLPDAKTILITFPLVGTGQSKRLTDLYHSTHPKTKPHWIQLGSTGIFKGKGWSTNTSSYDTHNDRAIAEDELLSYSETSTVLNLAGLYDDEIRQPRNWVSRVVKTKEDVAKKQNVHLIHGKDVARGIVAVHRNFDAVKGQRWILTDLFSYDWWALLLKWGGKLENGSEIRQVVLQVMLEAQVRALPRAPETFDRALDAREFWAAVGVVPEEGWVS
jgi:hypothetical protein